KRCGACLGQTPIRHERRVPQQLLREQLAPRHLDPELLLEPKDDVEKVDRFRFEVARQGCFSGDLAAADAQRLNQNACHPFADLVSRQYHVATSSSTAMP